MELKITLFLAAMIVSGGALSHFAMGSGPGHDDTQEQLNRLANNHGGASGAVFGHYANLLKTHGRKGRKQ